MSESSAEALPEQQTVVASIIRELTQALPVARREPIEAGRVRDYLAVLGEHVEILDLLDRAVPAPFILTLGRIRRPGSSRGTAINAGNRFEFLAPIRIGDIIEISREVTDVEVRPGRAGRLFHSTIKSTYVNQSGALVATAEQFAIHIGR